MSVLLVWKERMKTFYDKWGQYIRPLLRFVLALVTMVIINSELGYNPSLNNPILVIVFSIVSIFFPVMVFLFAVCAIIILHVCNVSMILAVQLAIVFLILYFVYVRFVPEHGYTILLMALLFFIKIPYVMPLLLGLIASPVAVVPVGTGVLVYYLLSAVKAEASTMVNTTAFLTEDTLEIYNDVIKNVVSDKYMVYTIGVFAIVIIVIYILRRQKWNYASHIGAFCGVITNVLGFLIVDFLLEKSDLIGGMLLGTLVSAMIVWVIQFLRLTLDYSAIEILQFEDDEYYYYVKAIPKMTITKPDKQVTRINAQKETANTANLRDAIQQAYSESKEYVESIPEFDDDIFEIDEFKVEYDEKDFMDD